MADVIEETATALARREWTMKHPAMGDDEDIPVEEHHRASARIAYSVITRHFLAQEVAAVEAKWKALL